MGMKTSSRLAAATSMGMAFVGGYVDVVGFVLLFGLFVAHATGNIVMLGVSLAGGGEGLTTKLLALPVFIAAAGATYALIRRLKARNRACETVVLALQGVVLTAFMLLTVPVLPAPSADRPAVVLASLMGVVAMAVQNIGARVVFSQMAPTTMMTGNVTQVAIDLVDVLSSRGVLEQALVARIVKTWPSVAAFALGAVGGGAGVLMAGAWSLALAIFVVGGLGAAHALASRAVGP